MKLSKCHKEHKVTHEPAGEAARGFGSKEPPRAYYAKNQISGWFNLTQSGPAPFFSPALLSAKGYSRFPFSSPTLMKTGNSVDE
jgi:hypothetical protein